MNAPVPDPTLIACHIDESAGMDPAVNPPEATEAVRRATIAAAHRAGVGFAALDAPTQALHLDVTRTGLAAALDVEEMARVLDNHQRVVGPHGLTRTCTCGIALGPVGNLTIHQARALRVAVLGGAW